MSSAKSVCICEIVKVVVYMRSCILLITDPHIENKVLLEHFVELNIVLLLLEMFESRVL